MKGRKQKQRIQPLASAALQDHLCRQFAVGNVEKMKRRGQCRQPLNQCGSMCAKCGSNGARDATPREYSLDPEPPPLTLAQKLGLVEVPTHCLNDEDWGRVKGDSNKRQDSALPCPICQEEFGLGKQALLSCSHVFHLVCLKSFERFSRSKRCPLCRRENYQTRVIFEGADIHRQRAATLIQSVWRGYVVRRWYMDLREKVPPTNPILRRKYFESKLSRLTEQMVVSCAVSSEGVEAVLMEADIVVENAQSVMRVVEYLTFILRSIRPLYHRAFDLCTKDTLDWVVISELSKHHLSSDCAVCLMPLHPALTPSQLTSTSSQLTTTPSQQHTGTPSQLTSTSSQLTNTPSQLHTGRPSQLTSTPSQLANTSSQLTNTASQQLCSKQVDLLSPRTAGAHRPLTVLSCSHLLHTTCIEALECYSLEQPLFLCPLCRAPYHRRALAL